jgi:hypothetical protein
MDTIEYLSLLFATAMSLVFFTIIWRDNPAYRFVEYTFMGAWGGQLVVFAYENILKQGYTPLISGNVIPGIMIIIGFLFLFRLSPKQQWLTRYPTAILIGVGVGVTLRTIAYGQFLKILKSTIEMPLTTSDPATNITNLIFIIMTACSVLFFVFTTEHKGPFGSLGYITRFGRWTLMLAFGASYAGRYMMRSAVLIDFIRGLIKETLPALLGG